MIIHRPETSGNPPQSKVAQLVIRPAAARRVRGARPHSLGVQIEGRLADKLSQAASTLDAVDSKRHHGSRNMNFNARGRASNSK
jgi:hypothetical protein